MTVDMTRLNPGMRVLVEALEDEERVFIVGRPACAKTDRAHLAAELCGRRLISTRGIGLDRVDISGALIPDVAQGITRSLPLELMRDLRTTTIPTLWFIDDLGMVPHDVQSAFMGPLDRGELSPHVVVWAASNRAQDSANSSCPIEPLRSRFPSSFIIPGPDDKEDTSSGGVFLQSWDDEWNGWLEWAQAKAQCDPIYVAFHRNTTGAHVYGWRVDNDPSVRFPDYRAWHASIRRWNHGRRSFQVHAAILGKPTANLLLAYADLGHKLTPLDTIRAHPETAPVPSENEPMVLYMQISMMAHGAQPRDVSAWCLYLNRLPRIQAAVLANDLERDVRLQNRFRLDPTWRAWMLENQDLFVGA